VKQGEQAIANGNEAIRWILFRNDERPSVKTLQLCDVVASRKSRLVGSFIVAQGVKGIQPMKQRFLPLVIRNFTSSNEVSYDYRFPPPLRLRFPPSFLPTYNSVYLREFPTAENLYDNKGRYLEHRTQRSTHYNRHLTRTTSPAYTLLSVIFRSWSLKPRPTRKATILVVES